QAPGGHLHAGQRHRTVHRRGADRRTVTGTISNRLVKISDREERTIMSIEKVRAYFKPLGIEERIREFDVSSATVELAAVAVGVEGARI
ncbi:ABC transmembrane type-1 domain-containing protein, partial [Dysosmobacter welbionis]